MSDRELAMRLLKERAPDTYQTMIICGDYLPLDPRELAAIVGAAKAIGVREGMMRAAEICNEGAENWSRKYLFAVEASRAILAEADKLEVES